MGLSRDSDGRPCANGGHIGNVPRHSGASPDRLGLAASARRALAVSAGKAARSGIRRLGRGSGSTVPGLAALSIDPGALAGLVAEIPRGSVLVTGSNGKGTTCRMLAQVMRAAGLRPLLNREGANQRFGLAATMIGHARPTGHLRADPRAIGLFEVDEGSFPQILPDVTAPAAVVVTNVFRDQLDRYFEPGYVTALLQRTMRRLPADTTFVLNADDPRVAQLAPDLPNPRFYFGVADPRLGRDEPDPTSDSPRCPRCDGELSYSCVYYAHLGHWRCTDCGLARPRPHVTADQVDLTGPSGSKLGIATPTTTASLAIPLPGLYNAYNAAAAVAAAEICGLPDWSFPALEQITAGSLRMERVQVADHDVYLALAKNANGYTEVLRAVLGDREPKRMLLGLNDFPGKQPDTSWIWDVDFDSMTGLVRAPVLSGNRAADLAVRLKYAGWLGSAPDGQFSVEPDPVRAFQTALARTEAGQPMWVVSTQLVLRHVRDWLRHQGYVKAMWQEQGGAASWRA
jgi:lipid II isoglutaminyl synthase (glutamine-hydrolysing)